MSAATATISGNERVEKKDADEGRTGERDQRPGLQAAPADADQRLDHDHQDGGLDAEQRAVDP